MKSIILPDCHFFQVVSVVLARWIHSRPSLGICYKWVYLPTRSTFNIVKYTVRRQGLVGSGYRSLKGKKEVILGGADIPENIFNWAQQS